MYLKNRNVVKTSVFPAPKEVVFDKLKELKTLQYIAKPYATFLPDNGQDNLIWKENAVFSFRFQLFGWIPFGTHTITVISFSEDGGIYIHEHNPHVPIWNHRIVLEQIDQNRTQYTDEVEIGAGWKTPFIYLWAKAFYAHRQRKWIALLRDYAK
ncbi:MAG: hypothetical protein PHO41_04445 [Eubacteriales bacterium]|nr:hypothetical protein [Eubacteriales bacterium]